MIKEQTITEEGHVVHYLGKVESVLINYWYSTSVGNYVQRYDSCFKTRFYYSAETIIDSHRFLFGSLDKNNAKHPDSMREFITNMNGASTGSKSSPSILLARFNKKLAEYKKNTGNDLTYLIQQNLNGQQKILNKKLNLCILSLII